MILLYIIAAVLAVSLISLVGIAFIGINEKKLKKITHLLVSFSAGTMLGGAFLHILPEAMGEGSELTPFILVIVGIMLFFIIEKFLHWRHCHEEKCEVHAVAYLNLVGDAVHNFMDGITIAIAFIVSIPVGIATTIAILTHEIPQEIGDFGLLIHSGFTRKKALMYNLLSALAALIGAVLTYAFATYTQNIGIWLMPIAAGGFIYMAGTDLMPELHKEKNVRGSMAQFILMAAGIVLMWILKIYLEVT